MKKPKNNLDYMSAFVDKEGVLIGFPDRDSPYVPLSADVTIDSITLDMYDAELDTILRKRFEFRDLLIMHKALTRIFGKKPKKKRKV